MDKHIENLIYEAKEVGEKGLPIEISYWVEKVVKKDSKITVYLVPFIFGTNGSRKVSVYFKEMLGLKESKAEGMSWGTLIVKGLLQDKDMDTDKAVYGVCKNVQYMMNLYAQSNGFNGNLIAENPSHISKDGNERYDGKNWVTDTIDYSTMMTNGKLNQTGKLIKYLEKNKVIKPVQLVFTLMSDRVEGKKKEGHNVRDYFTVDVRTETGWVCISQQLARYAGEEEEFKRTGYFVNRRRDNEKIKDTCNGILRALIQVSDREGLKNAKEYFAGTTLVYR